MTPNKIVMDELRRQAVWIAPLCLILTGVLILFGRWLLKRGMKRISVAGG